LGIFQPFYSRKSHSKNAWYVSTSLSKDEHDNSKNAWWVSTSLFIRQKSILKMPGGYLPAFLFE
jgi:hypothetical protein